MVLSDILLGERHRRVGVKLRETTMEQQKYDRIGGATKALMRFAIWKRGSSL